MTESRYTVNRKGERVISDFRRYLTTGDPAKLTEGLYHALTMHGGFIAHFSRSQFAQTFNGHLDALLDGEMYPLTRQDAWENYGRHLENTVYSDGLTAAQVMQGISAVACELEQMVREREGDAVREQAWQQVQACANQYGWSVTR